MEFNKKRFLENFDFLRNKENKKIGELETACKVSAGYFSRLRSDDNNATPNIETLAFLADELNVTIDLLLNGNLIGLTEAEQYVIQFIDKINKDTIDNIMEWDRLTYSQAITIRDLNPLFGTDGYRKYYWSHFESRELNIDSEVCVLEKGNTKLFVFCLNDEEPNDFNDHVKTYEVFMFSRGGLKKLANANRESKKQVYDTIEKLYQIAYQSGKNIKIDDDLKQDMDEFLKSFDIPDCPF